VLQGLVGDLLDGIVDPPHELLAGGADAPD